MKAATVKLMALPVINPPIHFVAGNLLPARISHRLPLSVRHVDYRLGIGADAGTVRLPTFIGLASHPTSMVLGYAFDEGVAINIATLDN